MENVSIATSLVIGRETALSILKKSRKLKQAEHPSQGLHMRRNLAKGDVDLRVGNGARVAALAVGTYVLSLPSGLVLNLENCYFVPSLTKNIISVSYRGGEYLSHEFDELLKECGIVSQLTPPGMPQWNGVSERRNRTLLDMVRSMMSHSDLQISFWGHALETAAFTLNRVPSKSVQKTPHEMWTGKRPKDRRNIELEEVQQQQDNEPEVERFSQTVEENSTDLETRLVAVDVCRNQLSMLRLYLCKGFNNLLEQDDKGDVSAETMGPAPAEVSAGTQISAERLLCY
ncbi:hypothetical protein V6N12_007819 [Hibiscus sabdariffa]|uniref:Integrase catalytic domain-containing protein n=1 Tax=Hibiscus sabdariffa TaxID=183260 RepID=A0ABR2F2W2_9ROSI